MITTSLFSSVINNYIPEPQSSLLNGILFGINIPYKNTLYNSLQRTGLLHLVVLSGSNISFLSAVIAKITSRFGRITSSLITIPIIILFIYFVSPQAPILRAGIAEILTIVAVISGKRALPLYLLFLSFFFIIIFRPDWLQSISLYLSYGATLGIILFSKTERKSSSLSSYVRQELRTTLSAQIFTAPLIFVFFRQVSIISPLSNILVAWTIPPLMILGFLTALLGKLHPLLGVIPSLLCYGILSYAVWIIKALSTIPYTYFSF